MRVAVWLAPGVRTCCNGDMRALARKLNDASNRWPWRTAIVCAVVMAPVFALIGWLTGPGDEVGGFVVQWVTLSIVVFGFAGLVRRGTPGSRDRSKRK